MTSGHLNPLGILSRSYCSNFTKIGHQEPCQDYPHPSSPDWILGGLVESWQLLGQLSGQFLMWGLRILRIWLLVIVSWAGKDWIFKAFYMVEDQEPSSETLRGSTSPRTKIFTYIHSIDPKKVPCKGKVMFHVQNFFLGIKSLISGNGCQDN